MAPKTYRFARRMSRSLHPKAAGKYGGRVTAPSSPQQPDHQGKSCGNPVGDRSHGAILLLEFSPRIAIKMPRSST